jgi:EmrB/QacA subfamily drug resistance transporter
MNEAETKRYALIVASIASFLTPFMGSAVNIALPSIGYEFAIDAVILSWIQTAYLLAAAIFLVSIGRISDIYGRKKFFLYGIILFTISSLLAGLSPSAIALIAFRVLQGFGSAMIFGTGVAIITSVFPVGERGKALGITIAAVYIGLSLGPFLGGLLTEFFGWRAIFLINVPLGIITTAFTFWKLKGEWAEAKGEKFDLTGAIIYSLVLVAIMYGLSVLPAQTGAWIILVGFVGLFIFVKWELRTESPVLDMNLFKTNRVFTFSNLAALIHYSATFAVAFLLSLYLQYIKGLSPLNAGLILVAQPVMQAIFSPPAGRLSDKIEPRIVASSGMTITSVGLLLLIFLTDSTPLIFIIVSLGLLGFGFALFSSPNTNAIMSSVEKRCYGIASSMVSTMRLIGQMLSMGIAMLLFTLYIGRVQITVDTYPLFLLSVQVAFIIFTVLCVIGIFASLVRGKLREEDQLAECKLPENS